LTVGLENSLENDFTKAMGGIGSASSYDTAERDFGFLATGNANFCGKGLIFVEALLRTCADFPPERVLSHDILEGERCKTAFCGETMFTEGFPKTFESYFKRLDRWVRGDFQNLIFLFSRKFGIVSKLKLLDNARRALTPFFVLLTLFASFWVYSEASTPLAIAAILCYTLPSILGIIKTIITAIFKQSGFTSAQEYWYKDLAHLAYSVVLLPTLAVKQLKASLTAIFRLITGKRLLEWTTARSTENEHRDPISFWFLPELLGILLLLSPSNAVKLFSLAFISLPLLIILGELPKKSKTDTLTYRQKRELSSHIASMWQFYADYVTEAENFLPPDNVQQAPVYKICHRTSPTNIGLYMLSCLVACDRRLISVENLQKRLDFTLNSVEKLKKYKGNLYNWYNTQDLSLCPNPFVSSVDSGNFVCCLVALCEGLKEYLPQLPNLRSTIERLQKIIEQTDLSVFYNSAKELLSIGISPDATNTDSYFYDCLMSEARLTSYYAIATRKVPKKHWKRLSRRELSYGFTSGTASYSGTMFEYFMPYVFTPSPEGSLIHSAQSYALQVQQRYAKRLGKPFGVSESGYYAFDADMCYLYKAHGVPKTGLRQGLEKELVISPYSTYLSLEFSTKSGFENIERLKGLGLWGRYGLYEAIDFNGKTPKIVKSHMAHHLGMSILAAHNLLEDGKIRKRFMRNKYMAGASELLNERPTLGRRIFENAIIKPKTKKEEEIPQKPEFFGDISPFAPKFKLLSGGEYSLAICDSGVSFAQYRGKAVYRKTKDLALNPQGLEIGVAVDGKGEKFEPKVAEFGIGYAQFEAEFEGVFTKIKAQVHKTLP
ncbi:MAG: hypothetical protein IKU89_04640, partial [Oscillospiraceae bacterium]|nr:hypothetical protein [Oscillospiraceae bacterium]